RGEAGHHMQTDWDRSASSDGGRVSKRQLEVLAKWGDSLLELRRVDANADVVFDDIRLEREQHIPGRVAVGPLTFELRWAPEVQKAKQRADELDFRFAKVMALVAMAIASFAIAAHA